MNCSHARSIIGPDLVPTPTSTEAEGAFEHYEKCDACRRFYAHQIRLANRLKLLSTQRAPAPLVDRVRAAIEAEAQRQASSIPNRARRRWVAGGLVAAAAAVAVMVFGPQDTTNPARQTAAMLARTAHDSSAAADRMTSAEPAQLRSWFATRVGTTFEIPEIPDANITGGRVAQLEGVTTASIRYQYRGMELTYFMIPPSAMSDEMPEDDDLWSFTANGYELVLWREGATTRAVMAPMPRSELEAIAEHCRSKAMI